MSFLKLTGPISWLFLLHAVVGTVALASLFIPLLTRKGGKAHRRMGWVFTAFMALAVFSAYGLTSWRIFWDTSMPERSKLFSVFLFYVATLTGASLWQGILVLRSKARQTASKEVKHLGPSSFLFVTGVTVCVLGLMRHHVLLIGFSLVGIYVASSQLKYWLTKPSGKMHWWFAHMEAMFAASIAAVTAMAVTALPKLLPSEYSLPLMVWLAPTLVGVPLLFFWKRFYKNKFQEASLKAEPHRA